jgi:hypothetical protein
MTAGTGTLTMGSEEVEMRILAENGRAQTLNLHPDPASDIEAKHVAGRTL